jgi:hypothetical protein
MFSSQCTSGNVVLKECLSALVKNVLYDGVFNIAIKKISLMKCIKTNWDKFSIFCMPGAMEIVIEHWDIPEIHWTVDGSQTNLLP